MVSSTKDAFVRKVEVKLNRSKSGKETVKGGYHTEHELKIPEFHGSITMFLHATPTRIQWPIRSGHQFVHSTGKKSMIGRNISRFESRAQP